MALNWLDIILLSITSLSIIFGFTKGFIARTFSIVALIGSVTAAILFYDLVGELFIKHNLIQQKPLAQISGFIAIMLGTFILLKVLGWGMRKAIEGLELKWADKAAGAFLGLILGIMTSTLLISLLTFILPPTNRSLSNSVVIPYVKKSYSTLKDSVPRSTKKKLQESKDSLKKAAGELKETVKSYSPQTETQVEEEKTDSSGSHSP
ncbi:MAG: CvpA family protein [Thermodesulfobacteriota bacterium]